VKEVNMAVGSLIICPHCGNTFARKAREHFCSDHCRFWHKVDRAGPDDCWLWKGTKPAFGHGQISFGGGPIYAHRFAWEEVNGPIPHGMCALHKCDVPHCVNPSHLFLGTREDNLADMRQKKRGSKPPHKFGMSHNQAKLNDDIVRAIRASNDDQLTLSRRFGIARRTVNSIVNRKTWKHVK
jgi:hypothetical protein